MNILGLSFFYHDSAAALVKDGVLVAAAEEERFSRVKHDSGFPALAIEFALKTGGITLDDVDFVVFYEKPFVKFERMLLTAMATFPKSAAVFRESMQRWISDKLWIKSMMARKLKLPRQKFLFADHHMSHAAASFFTSPFEESAILTVDGAGEWTTSTMGIGRGRKIDIQKEIRFPHSLGLLYSAFTAYCGFEINEGEYKLMGMHPYGQPKYVDKIYEILRIGEDGSLWHDMRYFQYHYSTNDTLTPEFERHFGKPRRNPKDSDKTLDPYYCDMAASIQKVTEEVLLRMVNHLYELSGGMKNLCLSGGVALNSVANYKILRQGPFENVYIHPAPGDDGGSVGAAYWAYNHVLEQPRGPALNHAYLGSEHSDADIEAFLLNNDIEYEFIADDQQFYEFVAQQLEEGKVCGWFRGRFEWGPRALGARSIIADPRRAEMKEKLNASIKFREAFRPFAPSVLEERANEFFDIPEADKHFPARFMLYVAPVREEKRAVLPAITHEDGSGRLQTVFKDTNPAYHAIIEAFGRRTGVPVVMNTSFNLKGEPIVESPAHAFNTFSLSGMDLLFLNNFVIRPEAKKKIAETKFHLRHEGDSVTQMVS
ncbi:MAG: carbamoyltransferase [Planctomycetes bacterium]|nr:carbamoyltransferase [Planctomycetota bacterium]HPF14054.1 carbamoyltransferase [Planctomycetota bacterium]HRV80492.1 carbamoyltransferase [Planctomycetota bacterium]